jgi:hypothetical protein
LSRRCQERRGEGYHARSQSKIAHSHPPGKWCILPKGAPLLEGTPSDESASGHSPRVIARLCPSHRLLPGQATAQAELAMCGAYHSQARSPAGGNVPPGGGFLAQAQVRSLRAKALHSPALRTPSSARRLFAPASLRSWGHPPFGVAVSVI